MLFMLCESLRIATYSEWNGLETLGSFSRRKSGGGESVRDQLIFCEIAQSDRVLPGEGESCHFSPLSHLGKIWDLSLTPPHAELGPWWLGQSQASSAGWPGDRRSESGHRSLLVRAAPESFASHRSNRLLSCALGKGPRCEVRPSSPPARNTAHLRSSTRILLGSLGFGRSIFTGGSWPLGWVWVVASKPQQKLILYSVWEFGCLDSVV